MESTKGKKRKKRKVRVHYDRLIAQSIVLVILVLVFVWIFRSCFGPNEFDEGERGAIIEAVEAAERDAQKVLKMKEGTMERDNVLLEIKSKEFELRKAGYEEAADDYINKVKEILRQTEEI